MSVFLYKLLRIHSLRKALLRASESSSKMLEPTLELMEQHWHVIGTLTKRRQVGAGGMPSSEGASRKSTIQFPSDNSLYEGAHPHKKSAIGIIQPL